MDAKYSKDLSMGDFSKGTKRRLPICFCLDTSGSMVGESINLLRQAMEKFISTMKADEEVSAAADICIVTFGGKVDIVEPFGPIMKKRIPHIDVLNGSLTPIGEGILISLDLLNARMLGYKERSIRKFVPWLVVITDGTPEGEGAVAKMTEAVHKTNEMESQGKLIVFNIGVGSDADLVWLKKLSVKRTAPIEINADGLAQLFALLNSSSTAVVSGAKSDEFLYQEDFAKGKPKSFKNNS